MFQFLKALKKKTPEVDAKPKAKSAFAITHCITITKCESGKQVKASIEIRYDHEQIEYRDMYSGRQRYAGQSERFDSSAEIKFYLERLKLLQAKLEDVHCAMKREEES